MRTRFAIDAGRAGRPNTLRAPGFTLLEVMIALVIVSLGMMAVNTQLNNYAVTASYTEEKTLASWIGTNVITELSVQSSWPELGDSEREVEFGGRSWHVRIEVSETEVDNLRRVDVEVGPADAPDQVLHTVSGLVEPPPPRGFAPTQWSRDLSGARG